MERQSGSIFCHHDGGIGRGIILLRRHALRQRCRQALLTTRTTQDLLLIAGGSHQRLTREAEKDGWLLGVIEPTATRTTIPGLPLRVGAADPNRTGIVGTAPAAMATPLVFGRRDQFLVRAGDRGGAWWPRQGWIR